MTEKCYEGKKCNWLDGDYNKKIELDTVSTDLAAWHLWVERMLKDHIWTGTRFVSKSKNPAPIEKPLGREDVKRPRVVTQEFMQSFAFGMLPKETTLLDKQRREKKKLWDDILLYIYSWGEDGCPFREIVNHYGENRYPHIRRGTLAPYLTQMVKRRLLKRNGGIYLIGDVGEEYLEKNLL